MLFIFHQYPLVDNQICTSRNEQNYTPLAWNSYKNGKRLAINLEPTLQNSSNFSNISIIPYDDSCQSIPIFSTSMNIGNINASRFIDAIGIENYRNKFYTSSVLDLTYSTFPRKPILNTEICFTDTKLGSWNNAEALALDIIDNLRHDSTGYVVNNLILNIDGGPSKQQQDVPIRVSDDYTEFFKQPICYILAHFSKYITPISVRLDTYTDKKYRYYRLSNTKW